MSMKYKVAALFVFSLLVNATQAAYLYWRINETDRAAIGIEALSAKVVAVDSSGNTTELQTGIISKMPETGAYINLDTLGEPSAYSFYVELLNYNSTAGWYVAGVSEKNATYSELVASNYIDTGTTPITPVQIWHGGSIVIPEPTTGMLVMFGFGLLALKRREKIGPTECRREIS